MPGTMWILRGLPASGKTTHALAMLEQAPLGTMVRLNRDNLRTMMLPAGYREPQWDVEETVSLVQHGPITALLSAGVDVVIDDTNLRTRDVRQFAQHAVRAGAHWFCIDDFLTVDVEECVRRDALRERPVGEDVIRSKHNKFLSGGRRLPVPVIDVDAVPGRPYEPKPGTPRAIIVDIDGTVALHDVRGPYDTSLYHLDRPNVSVIETVQMAADAGYVVLFTSGRSAEFCEVTVEWLCKHVITAPMAWTLFMRPAGDTRRDDIVKLELFDQHIRDSFDVRWALDDRDRVVAAWRAIGLTCMQVAEGNF